MNKNKLITAYSDLINHLHDAMENTLHSFVDALEISKQKTAENHNLTAEELNNLSNHVERDVHHAAKNLPDSQANSLTEWLKFDIELLENLTLDAFSSVADKTRLKLAELSERAAHHVYRSGDITIAGTFICNGCGKEIAFKTTSEIPDCPVCHAHSFTRL